MKVLVTGAGGFIGSHLTERLIILGHDVTAVTYYHGADTFGWLDDVDEGIPPHFFYRKLRSDVRDQGAMRSIIKGHDRVYHLAALGSVPYSFDSPESTFDTNARGTLNVALACAEYGVELVHTSTSEVYGTALREPQDETHPLNPHSPYAASKIAADKMVEALCRSRGLIAVILRPFNTFGPRQSVRAVLPRLILGGALGNLDTRRDWSYVSDTVSAFMAAKPSKDCVTYNCGTGLTYSVREAAQELGVKIKQSDEQKRSDTAEVFNLCADARKLWQETGHTAVIGFKAGLLRTAKWFAGRKLREGFV